MLVDDRVCLEPEVDEVLRCVPATVGIENDQQEIAPVLGNFGYEAPPGFGGKAGLDPFDARDTAKESVGVVQHIGAIPIDRHNHRAFFTDQLAEDRLLKRTQTQLSQILSGGVVVRPIKSTGIAEMGIRKSEGSSLGIHQRDKLVFITTDMLDSSQAGVICGHDQHCFQKILQTKDLSWLQPQMGFVCMGRIFTDRHLIIQLPLFKNDKGRHDLG